MATQQEITKIMCDQVHRMESKLRFLADNVDEIIRQLRIRQAFELDAYARNCDGSSSGYNGVYSLWRGQSIDNYVMNNLFSGRYSDSGKYISELRRDLEARGVQLE